MHLVGFIIRIVQRVGINYYICATVAWNMYNIEYLQHLLGLHRTSICPSQGLYLHKKTKNKREDRPVSPKTWQNDIHILTVADINTRVTQNVMCSLIDTYPYQGFRRICFLHSQESSSSGPPYTYHEDPLRSVHTSTLKMRAAGPSYTLIATYHLPRRYKPGAVSVRNEVKLFLSSAPHETKKTRWI